MEPDTHAKYAQNGKVMVGSAILLFLVVFIIIFFHIYGQLCLRRRRSHLFLSRISTNFFTAAPHFNEGLDPSILKSLPIFTYSSAATHHRSLTECAVCLSEFADDDEGRVLPGCNHAFHSHCIDTWFRSHSNCPLCRAPVRQAVATAPVQQAQGTPPPTASSNMETGSVSDSERCEAGLMEEGHAGCSSLPAPIGCPRIPLASSLGINIIVELPPDQEEDERVRGSDLVTGDPGLKGSDNRILSLKRFCSV